MDATAAVLGGLDQAEPWLEELYRHLHRNPELSGRETATAAEVTRRLTDFGYDVQQVGGGVVGVLANGPGPTVLFRADMDGLPVRETTGLPYASTRVDTDSDGNEVPVMHACGHDFHVAAGIGAAHLLARAREHWSGTHIALFQPAEETAAGARAMVDAGLADKIPVPDVALGQHVLTAPVSGHVATAAGPVLSTGASVRVRVFGKGSHGSMPHLSVDPVVLAASIVLRLQTLVSRELAPSQFGVVTIGSLQAGTKSNIIADDAVLLLNVRAYEEAVREQLLAGIERVVRAECEASRSPSAPEIEVYESYPLTANDPAAHERVRGAFVAAFGSERVDVLEPVTASEDFSILPRSLGVPYVYWGFGGFTDGQEVFPNHNPAFGPALQPTLRTGTQAATVAALAWLART